MSAIVSDANRTRGISLLVLAAFPGAASASPLADADLPTLIGCGCLALVVVIPLAILVEAAFLHLAARIVRLEGGFGTACKAALLVLVFSFFLNLAWSLARIDDPLAAIALNLVLGLVISAFAVKLAYGSTFWHALGAYVVASLIQIAVAAVVVLVIVVAVAGLAGSEAGEEFLQELRERWEEVQRQGLDSVPSPFGSPSDERTPKPPPDDAQATLVPWPPARAGEQVGREVQAFLVDGREISGTLQAVRGDTLTIAQHVTGGTISRQVRMGEIRELRVLIFH